MMMGRRLLFNYLKRCHCHSIPSQTNSMATTQFGFEKVPEDEKRERVKTVFANVAKKYDLMNDAMSLGIHRLWKDYYVQRLKIAKDSQIIDVAGGTGDIAFRALDTLKTLPAGRGTITVVDINEKMIDIGRSRASSMYKPTGIADHLNWVPADAEALPFPDNTFDIYTIAFGIRNCTHPDKVLSEAFRILKPNGVFSCMEFGHVAQPLLRQIYDAYSFQMIPVMGQILVGDFDSYKYLVESIRVFPNQWKFSQMIKEAGFRKVTYEQLSFGISNIYTGIK